MENWLTQSDPNQVAQRDFAGSSSIPQEARASFRLGESTWLMVLGSFACISILTTASIVYVLFHESSEFFKHVALSDFVFGTTWSPLIEPRAYGVVPLVFGTLMISLGASAIAIPLGLGGAFYLAEYAHPRTRRIVKPLIELLAGIPSVVFGYFAVTIVTPFLQKLFPSTEVFNAASACVVLGVMILPTITSLGDDAIRSIPTAIKQGGFALGATKLEVCKSILFPAALSGIVAAIILAFSRAVGETMAVSLAAGSTPNMTLNPLQGMQTMTAYIVQVSLGDTPRGSIEYQSIFAVAVYLFFITLAMNIVSRTILKKFRQKYE